MVEKERFYKRLNLVLILLFFIIIILLINITVNPTSSRYIKQEKDEILASYTALYFNSDSNNLSLSLENDIGHVSFKLMNYLGEDVTKRDIEYVIQKPSQFYDSQGREITNPTGEEDLYVLDVWGTPKKVGNDSYKYQTEIVQNDGEISTNGNYCFVYEPLGSSAIGKIHNVTIQLTRELDSEIQRAENVSIVVQLIKPYREVFIIDVIVSNQLIVFSNNVRDLFETKIETLYIQSSNIYSHYKVDDMFFKRTVNIDDQIYEYTSKAFLVTIYWQDLLLNLNQLKDIHIGIGENPSNIDITKPYIIGYNATYGSGMLKIYVPQASDFYLDFLPIATNYQIDAKVEVCVKDVLNNEMYMIYNEAFGGYQHNNKNNLPFEENSEDVFNLITK